MARRPNVIPSVERRFSIPLDVDTRVRLELHSDLEGRVPHGDMSKLVTQLLRNWLDARTVTTTGVVASATAQLETPHG